MFKWKKLGKVFDPIGYDRKPWMCQYAQSPSAVIFRDFIRVYFCTRSQPDKSSQYISRISYIDLDKNNLSKIINVAKSPILELGILGTFDEFGTYPVSCLKNNEDIICFYGGWTRCKSVPFDVSLGMAISKDNGNSFKKIGNGPILSTSKDEPFIISSPRIRKFNNTWYLFYISGTEWVLDNGKPEPVYKIRMAISNDLLEWEKVNKNIITDKLNKDEAQASPDVIHFNNMYHMFFSYRQAKDYRLNKNNSYRIGYAYSSDLLNWTRDDSLAGIGVSKTGWDSEMVSYPNLFELNKDIYMLYQGNETAKYGFGLAKLEST